MENYFTTEISRLEKEILMLKTTMRKSAGVIPMEVKLLTLQISLSLNSAQTLANGKKYIKIIPNKPALILLTLDKYQNNIYYDPTFVIQDGWALVQLVTTPSGAEIADVSVRGSDADVQTLKNGGTVTKTVKLLIQCSDNFTTEEL